MYKKAERKDSYILKSGFSCREFGGEFVAVADGE